MGFYACFRMIGHDLTPWFKCSSLVTQTKTERSSVQK